MRRTLLAALLCAPFSAFAAGHLDVVKMKLNEDCSLAELLEITSDFNEWGAEHGYHARIAAPLQDEDLAHLYWMGESANTATFGAAWDVWRDAQADADSTPSKLAARFQGCTSNVSRHGFDLY